MSRSEYTFTIPHRVRARSRTSETITISCMECDWTYPVGNVPDVLKMAQIVQAHLDDPSGAHDVPQEESRHTTATQRVGTKIQTRCVTCDLVLAEFDHWPQDEERNALLNLHALTVDPF